MITSEKDKDGFVRRVNFEAAYDKRDPDPSKNYGIHGVTLRFELIGPLGATVFTIYTNWQLPHVVEEMDSKPIGGLRFPHLMCRPMPADLGYHSPVAQYEEQEPLQAPGKCDLVPAGFPCFYDGSALAADEIAMPALLAGGDEAVWKLLRDHYDNRFAEKQENPA